MHATIIMEGRLVTDPEIKSGKNGDYCTFRFVVNTKYGNQDNASFFNCTASEYIANRMQKAGIKKGRLIEIIGNLNLRPYETDEGIRQISADVSVLEWHFTGSKPMRRTLRRVRQKPHRRAPVRYARSRRFQVAMTMTTSPSDLDIHIWAVSVVNACSPFCFVHSKIYIRKD